MCLGSRQCMTCLPVFVSAFVGKALCDAHKSGLRCWAWKGLMAGKKTRDKSKKDYEIRSNFSLAFSAVGVRFWVCQPLLRLPSFAYERYLAFGIITIFRRKMSVFVYETPIKATYCFGHFCKLFLQDPEGAHAESSPPTLLWANPAGRGGDASRTNLIEAVQTWQ